MIDEKALINYLQENHPFGITQDDLWEQILSHGGNNPLVTKEMLMIALLDLTASIKRNCFRSIDSIKNINARPSKFQRAKSKLLSDLFGDVKGHYNLWDVKYKLFGIKTHEDLCKYVSLKYPRKEIWNTIIKQTAKTRKELAGKEKIELFSTQTIHLKGLVMMLNYMVENIIIVS